MRKLYILTNTIFIMDQHNNNIQKIYRTDLFPLVEKRNLTDKTNLSGSPGLDSNYTINQVFILHDPLDNTPL